MSWRRGREPPSCRHSLTAAQVASVVSTLVMRGVLGALVAAVASFSLLASAVYLVNDVVDVESDRAHPSKRHRPIAAGQLGVPAALTASGTLAVLSLALALPALVL